MSWWNRLTGGKSEPDRPTGRVDYLSEALALERQGDYDAALTSYKLALRDRPNDPRVLQNMAIAYSRVGQQEDAIRCYRRALELEPSLGGAHYGLAFLLLKRGDDAEAVTHLDAFLGETPRTPDTEQWMQHASATLARLRGEPAPEGPGANDASGWAGEGPPR